MFAAAGSGSPTAGAGGCWPPGPRSSSPASRSALGCSTASTAVDSLSPEAESVVAEHRIRELVSDGPIVYRRRRRAATYTTPDWSRPCPRSPSELRTIDGVVDVDDLYTSPGGRIGADNRSTLVRVELQENLPVERQEAIEDQVRAKLKTIDAPTVLVGGDHLARAGLRRAGGAGSRRGRVDRASRCCSSPWS